MPNALLETSLFVDDLERARTFYQRVFGFGTLLEDERMIGLEVPGRTMLLLFRRGAARDRVAGDPRLDEAGSARHLRLEVPAASLLDWERHLSLNGIVIESRIHQPNGGTSLYFHDPDGHSLEVATPGLWQDA